MAALERVRSCAGVCAMSKYTDVNIAGLTLEDALADSEWGKKPGDYLKFVGLDMALWQGLAEGDFDCDTWWEFTLSITYYVVHGIEPDFANIHDSGVKQAVRNTIAAFKERLNGEYLKHYRQYVAAVQRNEKKQLEVT